MPFRVTSDKGNHPPKLEIEFEVEKDEDVFMTVYVRDWRTGDSVVEFTTTAPEQVDAFFASVETARAQWEKYKSQG